MTRRPTVPGVLDLAALQALYGNTQRDSDRMRHFELLTVPERKQAVRRMAAEGFSDDQIASACRLAVEMVRRVLAERSNPA